MTRRTHWTWGESRRHGLAFWGTRIDLEFFRMACGLWQDLSEAGDLEVADEEADVTCPDCVRAIASARKRDHDLD